MKTKAMLALVGAALSATLLSGCVVALGNRVPPDAKHSSTNTNATLGKQLTDLKQARDSGAINEEEYQTAKKRLIDGK